MPRAPWAMGMPRPCTCFAGVSGILAAAFSQAAIRWHQECISHKKRPPRALCPGRFQRGCGGKGPLCGTGVAPALRLSIESKTALKSSLLRFFGWGSGEGFFSKNPFPGIPYKTFLSCSPLSWPGRRCRWRSSAESWGVRGRSWAGSRTARRFCNRR